MADLEKQAENAANAYLEAEEPTQQEGEPEKNIYAMLDEPEPYEHTYQDPTIAIAAGAGGLLGYGRSGAGMTPTLPSAKTISSSRFTPMVEKAFGVPQGSAAKIASAAKPSLMPTPDQTARILNGSIDPETGTTGRARMAFNAETSRLSQAGQEGQEILHELQSRGLVDAKGNPVVKAGPMSSTPSGVAVPAATAEETVAQQALKDAALGAKANTATRVAGALGTAGKVIPYAGAGLQAMDAYNRYNAGDKTGALIAGTMAAASIPLPILATAIGMPIQWVHDHPEQVHELYAKATGIVKKAYTPESMNFPM